MSPNLPENNIVDQKLAVDQSQTEEERSTSENTFYLHNSVVAPSKVAVTSPDEPSSTQAFPGGSCLHLTWAEIISEAVKQVTSFQLYLFIHLTEGIVRSQNFRQASDHQQSPLVPSR